ncbi:hypothetical protein HIM_02648 [Hirsutella minnesotensis 3608]|nr:hypothetical protein HIM_02648 [Hirsutella minnesotensis 3608]
MRVDTGALCCVALSAQWVSVVAARQDVWERRNPQQYPSSNDSISASPIPSPLLNTPEDTLSSLASPESLSPPDVEISTRTSIEPSSFARSDSFTSTNLESPSPKNLAVPPSESPETSTPGSFEPPSFIKPNGTGSPEPRPSNIEPSSTRDPFTIQTPGHDFTSRNASRQATFVPKTTPLSQPYSTSRIFGNSSQPLPVNSQSNSSLPASPSPGSTAFVTVDCTVAEGLNCTEPTVLSGLGQDVGITPTPTEPCTSIPPDRPLTSFSIVYTSTITFYGNRSDYTPPFKPISTPNYCQVTAAPLLAPGFAPPAVPTDVPVEKVTASASRNGLNRNFLRPQITFVTTDKNPSVAFPSDPVPDYSPTPALGGQDQSSGDHKTAQDNGGAGWGNPGVDQHMTAVSNGGQGSENHREPGTQGNPGGSYQPNGQGNSGAIYQGSDNHRPAVGDGGTLNDDGNIPDSAAQAIPKPDVGSQNQDGQRPSFRITARGDQVTINDKTFSDLQPDATSIVTASGAQFTILPNAVVGEGATIQKPAPAGTIISVAKPTTAVLDGVPVTLKDSVAIVGGTTLTMMEQGTTTVIQGRPVAITPGAIVVGKQTISFQPSTPPREQEMLVKGGEMLTAIGQSVVVIHSTTFTYGPGIAGTTKVVDGDTISIGASGVLVHGTLIGGSLANATDTRLEIVGGATITGMAPSIAVINGITFTVGPGTHWKTTIIGGETFTIGPTGVVMSTMTLKYPFGQAVTATVTGTATEPPKGTPKETAAASKEKDDSAGSLVGPSARLGWAALCIAIGVHLWA